MNHSKNILMRLVYFILLYFIYWNIFNYLKLDLEFRGKNIDIAIHGMFLLLYFAYYLMDLLNFDKCHYRVRTLLYSSVVNLVIFSIFYLFSRRIELVYGFIVFTVIQNLIKAVLLSLNSKVYSTIIIDSGEHYTDTVIKILTNHEKYRYLGYLCEEKNEKERYLGKIEDVKEIVKMRNADTIIFTSRKQIKNYANEIMDLKLQGITVIDYIGFIEEYEGKIDIEKIDSLWVVMTDGFVVLNNTLQRRIKRLFDIVMATIMFICFLPFMIITYVLVKTDIGLKYLFTDPMKIIKNPAFFKQKRIGLRGEEFEMVKFRSMKVHDPSKFSKYASKNDDRITAVGKFIRKTRLDEFPQLINVLKGEMSFVGPRPEWNELGRDYEKKIKNYKLRYAVQPGLTGWAQVMYSYGASVKDAEIKLEYDLYYIKHQDFMLDMMIFFKTTKTVLFGKGM